MRIEGGGALKRRLMDMGLVRRLAEMGFTRGARVRVLHSGPPGPVLVMVRGSRVALGRGVAMKVLVSPLGVA